MVDTLITKVPDGTIVGWDSPNHDVSVSIGGTLTAGGFDPYFPFTDQSDFDMTGGVDLGMEVSSNREYIFYLYVSCDNTGGAGATVQLERSDGDLVFIKLAANAHTFVTVGGGGVNGPDWIKVTRFAGDGLTGKLTGWGSIATWSNALPIVGQGTTYPSFSHVLR
jgi:hypothetical protein